MLDPQVRDRLTRTIQDDTCHNFLSQDWPSSALLVVLLLLLLLVLLLLVLLLVVIVLLVLSADPPPLLLLPVRHCLVALLADRGREVLPVDVLLPERVRVLSPCPRVGPVLRLLPV